MKQKIPKIEVRLFSAVSYIHSECIDEINTEIGLFGLTKNIISATSTSHADHGYNHLTTTVLYQEYE